MNKAEAKRLRLSLGMTQAEMARYLGLRDKSQVSHLESGRTPIEGPVARLYHILSETGGDLFPSVTSDE